MREGGGGGGEALDLPVQLAVPRVQETEGLLGFLVAKCCVSVRLCVLMGLEGACV